MITTYGDINQRTAAWAMTKMLEHARPILVLNPFGQQIALPRNEADTVKMRRPVPFTVSTVPLVEGVTPTAQQISYEDVTVPVLQYGGLTQITDKIRDMSEDPVLANATELMGELAAETLEMVLYGVLKGGTTVFYSNAADTARTDVDTAFSTARQQAVIRSLEAQRAKRISKMSNGSVKIGTVPIEAAFMVFGHTDLDYDLRAATGFEPTSRYGSMTPVSDHEKGSIQDCRYILSPLLTSFADAGASTSTMISTSASVSDVYPMLFVAKDSYGVVSLAGAKAIKPVVVNPAPSAGDPLGQRGYVGFKTYYACTILNQAWFGRLETAATDL